MNDQAAHTDEVVAIVGGTGALGSALAIQLARAGVAVRIGSRSDVSAAEAVRKIKDRLDDPEAPVTGHVTAEAVEGVEIVFLTVPFRAHSENMTNLKPLLQPGQLLVDTTVPLAAAISGKATRTIGVWQGSAAQQAQEMAPEGVTVVSTLHTISAVTLRALENSDDEDTFVMSDKKAARARIAKLIDRIPGLRAVDGGLLENARIAEQITALLIGVNGRYRTHAGIRLTNLPPREWD